jgi:AcrR family transcriptional regulator
MKKSKPGTTAKNANQQAARRRYNSPLRQQQAAQTRDSIIAAGVKLVHSYPAWDWTNLTALAVGERAGVSERTVQRHFPTERKLRDAVLQGVYEESGIGLEELELGTFSDVTARMFSYLSSFAVAPQPLTDPTFESMDTQRRNALFNAVVRATPDWTEQERENAAAVLDILWNYPPYERLMLAWGFDSARAIGAITWVIKVIAQAIQGGHRPNLDP